MASKLRNEAAAGRYDDGNAPEQNSREITKFQDLADSNMVHSNVINTITKGLGYSDMTDVQTMTINQGLQGQDM